MINFTRQTGVIVVTLMLLCVLPLLFSAIGESYLTTFFSRIFIYALVGVSLDLIIGQAGLVCFGHAAFFGIGAYVCGILGYHFSNDIPLLYFFTGTNNALISWTVSVFICMLLGLIIGIISLRTSGVYFIMITLALAQMIYFLVISIPQYGGADGLNLWQRNRLVFLDLNNDIQFYYVCLFILILYLLAALKVTHSSLGLIVKGAKFNHQRLISLGIHPFRYQLFIFVFSSAGAGLSGALMVNLTEYVSPDFLHWTLSGKFLVIVILGGLGSLFGGFYGALILLGLEEILSNFTDHWHLMLGIILVIMVLTSRQGLYAALTGKKQL